MKLSFPKIITILLFILAFTSRNNFTYAQIYIYAADTLGTDTFVAPNATGTAVSRVNGALTPSPYCSHGFSLKNFHTATTYSDTLEAAEVTVAPSTGHNLNVSGFSVEIRRSSTGPANARYAYSTDSGKTWIDQGADQTPNNSSCDSMSTGTWTKSISVAYPKELIFRIYGFNASGISGTFQIKYLYVNGAVTPITASGTAEVLDNGSSFEVYPNPVLQNATISYHLSNAQNVKVEIYNLVGQMVTSVVNGEMQQDGNYSYNVPVPANGIYFVKFCIGDQVFTKKIVKM